MLHVFICEDNKSYRMQMEKTVVKCIITEDYDADLKLSCASPDELLSCIDERQIKSGLFFLDVDLGCDINGIELASKIREQDISATIVFITTHGELAHLVFTYKVEAMDYIAKDSSPEEIERRVSECMKFAYKRYLDGRSLDGQRFSIKIGDQVLNILHSDILYFETLPDPKIQHKLVLHTITGKTLFRGHIKSCDTISPRFYRCHTSYVVNMDKVKLVDKKKRELEMVNGEIIPISVRKMQGFLNAVGAIS